ncbi:MAG: hypothetical protein ACUVT5_03955 [Candidatus Bathyarchaeales archaeon]
MDINWVWAGMLIIYHAVYSITVAVLLVELSFVGSAFLLGLLWLRNRVKSQLRYKKEEMPKQVAVEVDLT